MKTRDNFACEFELHIARIAAAGDGVAKRVDVGLGAKAQQFKIAPHQFIGDRHQLSEYRLRRLVYADVIAKRFRHFLHAVQAFEQRHGQHDLRLLAIRLLQLPADQQIVMSYTRSRAEGSQNGFDGFVGNAPAPVIRKDVYSNLPGDLPNRFLLWGNLNVPFKNFKIAPIVEWRNGFPWVALDQAQQYVGVPNRDTTRIPKFFSGDARLMRDFKVSSNYTVRLSVTGYNLTNHFNALAIHNNTADPQYGVYFGNYHRRYRFDFDFLF